MRNIIKFVVLVTIVVFGNCHAENFISPILSFEAGKDYEVKTNEIQKIKAADLCDDDLLIKTFSEQYWICIESVDSDGVADARLSFGAISNKFEYHGEVDTSRQTEMSRRCARLNVGLGCLNGKTINIKIQPNGKASCPNLKQFIDSLVKEFTSRNLKGRAINREVIRQFYETIDHILADPFQVSNYLPSLPMASGESWSTVSKTANYVRSFQEVREHVGVVLLTGFCTNIKKSVWSRTQTKLEISSAGEAELDLRTNIPNRIVLSTYRKQTKCDSAVSETLSGDQNFVTVTTTITRL